VVLLSYPASMRIAANGDRVIDVVNGTRWVVRGKWSTTGVAVDCHLVCAAVKYLHHMSSHVLHSLKFQVNWPLQPVQSCSSQAYSEQKPV